MRLSGDVNDQPTLSQHDSLELLKIALSQKSDMEGVSELLRVIAKSVDACGCAIWQVFTGSHKADRGLPEDTLFVLAQWFESGAIWAAHDVPLKESATGAAIQDQAPYPVTDIATHPRVYRHLFLNEQSIQSACAVPLNFSEEERGAITAYRKKGAPPFGTAEIERLVQFAEVTPLLYEAAREQVSFRLIRDVDEILHQAHLQPPAQEFSKDSVQAVARDVCKRLRQTFRCLEASLFLHDKVEKNPGTYWLAATTWPVGKVFPQTYTKDPQGITGWVIAHGKPVRIFDLKDFERDIEFYRQYYPGIEWRNSLDIEQVAAAHFGLSQDNLPPLSLMAAPLMLGSEVVGVIRCCTVEKGPVYFAARELKLLEVVAARLAQYWSRWMDQRRIYAENEFWRNLVDGLADVNRKVQLELKTLSPNDAAIEQSIQRLRGAHEGSSEKLLSNQLELYRELIRLVGDLRTAEDAVKEEANRQVMIYLDLGHQLKSPVMQAFTHVQTALGASFAQTDMLTNLRAIRGLLRKARRVALSTGMFAALSKGEPLAPSLAPVATDDLRKLLIETAVDHATALNPRRGIRFEVAQGTLKDQSWRDVVVLADMDMFEQALNNIYDNAGKYSYKNARVEISAGMDRGMFFVAVVNQGLRITREEIPLCIKREWRSHDARLTTGEGSGIGLWIVTHIMTAHGGQLAIRPTDASGFTEVRLYLRLGKETAE